MCIRRASGPAEPWNRCHTVAAQPGAEEQEAQDERGLPVTIRGAVG